MGYEVEDIALLRHRSIKIAMNGWSVAEKQQFMIWNLEGNSINRTIRSDKWKENAFLCKMSGIRVEIEWNTSGL